MFLSYWVQHFRKFYISMPKWEWQNYLGFIVTLRMQLSDCPLPYPWLLPGNNSGAIFLGRAELVTDSIHLGEAASDDICHKILKVNNGALMEILTSVPCNIGESDAFPLENDLHLEEAGVSSLLLEKC